MNNFYIVELEGKKYLDIGKSRKDVAQLRNVKIKKVSKPDPENYDLIDIPDIGHYSTNSDINKRNANDAEKIKKLYGV